MNLETKITIYKFTPQLFTLTRTFMTKNIVIQKNKYLKYGIHLPNMKFLFIYSSFVIH